MLTIAGQTHTIVQSGPPVMSLTSPVNFGAVNAAGTLTAQTPSQTIALTQVNPGTVTWTAHAVRHGSS
jgi:hypothetical protein